MKKCKVVLDFIRLAVAEKIVFFRNIINLMTGNALFPTPDVTLTVLGTLVDTLETDHTAAKSGSHLMVAKMNESETAADEAFRKLARYVDRIADGSEATILSSGFHASKQPEPALRKDFSVEPGKNPGEMILACSAVPGARAYVWQYCVGLLPVNEQGWIFSGSGTRAKFIIRGLESGSKCWFRVAAVTSAGMGPWSDPIMKVVS